LFFILTRNFLLKNKIKPIPLNHNRGVVSGSRFRLEKELKWVGQARRGMGSVAFG